MISYELAEKLKEAGFPNERVGKIFQHPEGKVFGIPTLSELIEACGDRFMSVSRNFRKDNWYATALPEGIFKQVPQAKDCKSPEEAVANLWLTLNRK